MVQTAATETTVNRLEVSESQVDDFLQKEWLLSNDRGSYSSATVLGCNTRRYHGLLVASLHPPIERVVTLSNVLDTVHIGEQRYELANFEFSDRLHPQGYRYLRAFWQDTGVHYRYDLDGIEVERAVYLSHDEDVILVHYDFSAAPQPVTLTLMPLVALRDFHGLQSSSTPLQVEQSDDVVAATMLDPHGPAVHMRCPGATFERGADWWYAMHYRQEAARGQHDYEDVWAPGMFRAEVACPGQLTLVVQATRGLERPGPLDFTVESLIGADRARNQQLIGQAQTRDETDVALVKAADRFVVRRDVGGGKVSTSILAGYHWFADWGRDTFIALPGLLLETGRYDEAREVLDTFGSVVSDGMIPNRFDDYGGEPHYNSVDASLWYIIAAYRYLQATNDDQTFWEVFRPTIATILQAYEQGTRFGIHADEDWLISAGDADTQLTWMDAKCNGVSFTPRYGKAVEINALWINALRIMETTTADADEKQIYAKKAKKAEKSFNALFWNEDNGCLNDCILTRGEVDAAVRPNQIYAVSLPFSPLPVMRQKAVVKAVREHLLTPFGLRSLSPEDSRYQGRYCGDQFQRDSAYHQGTVWAFLMGPFIEALLKTRKHSKPARKEAAKMIAPLLEHLHSDGCLGNICEIFDGDFPHRGGGCVAQAWSVAELLRAKRLIERE